METMEVVIEYDEAGMYDGTKDGIWFTACCQDEGRMDLYGPFFSLEQAQYEGKMEHGVVGECHLLERKHLIARRVKEGAHLKGWGYCGEDAEAKGWLEDMSRAADWGVAFGADPVMYAYCDDEDDGPAF